MKNIDLNSDLGESFGAYTIGNDAAILPIVSSANVACGFHAGDPVVMRRTVKLAIDAGTAIGAHPGLPDLVGFGRRQMKISPDEAYAIVVYQVGALAAFVKAMGAHLQHVKPHGALYNMAAKDSALAEAIAKAIADVDSSLILYGLAGSELIKAAEREHIRAASEVFADRRYMDDGSLMPRSEKGAVLKDEDEASAQALMMAEHGEVVTASGLTIHVKADTLCIHGDTPKALAFAKRIRDDLSDCGIAITPTGKFL
ncbi:MAG: LamB/YcsF family protein [Selenomonadaceae bacterium]